MDNIGLGLMLMLVGMVTVFVILLIVIYGSKLMIAVANRLTPAPAKETAADAGPDALTRQVLEAAVSQLTGGKGHITNIKKV